MNKIIYNALPPIVKTILLSSDTAFLIGSTLDKILNNEVIKDYDIIIEDREDFLKVVRTLSLTNSITGFNSFGGVKVITEDDILIDVWCGSLAELLVKTVTPSFYSLKNQKLYQNIL